MTTSTSSSPLLTCPPRFGTARNPDRPTLGPAIGKVAALLRKPLMPWQQYVADVVGEIDPATGQLAYSEVGLTVPRQSGKSTLILAKAVHRASATGFFGPRQRIVYTAQTRNKAREKWEEDYAGDIKASRAFGTKVLPHFGNGNEHLRFPNRSRFGIEANTEKAGHGGTLDEGYIDEAFAQVDGRLEQAFRPAMITRRNKQLWWVSTAGWEDASPYLEGKVKRGREVTSDGSRNGLAYFEWSAPEDADPEDESVWWACMPALGYTITVEAIAAELAASKGEGKLNDFRRAYLNQWVPKPTDMPVTVIDPAQWAALAQPDVGALAPVAFGLTVTPDRARSTIGVAARRRDGRIQVELAAENPGVDWVLAWMRERMPRWNPCAVVLDGTALPLLPQLEAINASRFHTTTSRERAQATVTFFDALGADYVRHTGGPKLTASAVAAQKRPLGDGWVWDGANVGPLVAVTLAHAGLLAHGAPKQQAPPPLLVPSAHGVSETNVLATAGF